MKKFVVSLTLILVFAFYALFASSRSNPGSVASSVSAATQPITNDTAPVPSASPATVVVRRSGGTGKMPTPTPTPKPTSVASSGAFKNGSYIGPTSDAYFGNVQVKVTVSGGKLTSVSFLQYPNDRGTSREINSQAMPVLVSEALKAQSANVDIVSGATQTSQAFAQSLGAALAQAAN